MSKKSCENNISSFLDRHSKLKELVDKNKDSCFYKLECAFCDNTDTHMKTSLNITSNRYGPAMADGKMFFCRGNLLKTVFEKYDIAIKLVALLLIFQ